MAEQFVIPMLYIPASAGIAIPTCIKKCAFKVEVRLGGPHKKDVPNFDWSTFTDYDNNQMVASTGFYTPFTSGVTETNVCAVDLVKSQLEWMTLSERLEFGRMYHRTTGQQLDADGSVTLCAGSRFLRGDVPIVYVSKGVVCIGSIDPVSCIGNSGPRQVWRN